MGTPCKRTASEIPALPAKSSKKNGPPVEEPQDPHHPTSYSER